MTSDGYRLIAFFGRGFSTRARADGTSAGEPERERERCAGIEEGRKIGARDKRERRSFATGCCERF